MIFIFLFGWEDTWNIKWVRDEKKPSESSPFRFFNWMNSSPFVSLFSIIFGFLFTGGSSLTAISQLRAPRSIGGSCFAIARPFPNSELFVATTRWSPRGRCPHAWTRVCQSCQRLFVELFKQFFDWKLHRVCATHGTRGWLAECRARAQQQQH